MRWCFADQTALAEAELEYEERSDPAIFVAFPLEAGAVNRFSKDGVPVERQSSPRVRADLDDDALDDPLQPRHRRPPRRDLPARVEPAAGSSSWRRSSPPTSRGESGWGDVTTLGTARGSDLAGLRYQHPLPPEMRGELTPEEEARSFRFVSGTTSRWTRAPASSTRRRAPARTISRPAIRENLPILSPVDEAGRFTTVREVPGQEGPRREPRDRGGPRRGRRAGSLRPGVPARVSPLLALQEPGDLPRHDPVVHPAGRPDTPTSGAGALDAIRRVRWVPAWGEAADRRAWSRTAASG